MSNYTLVVNNTNYVIDINPVDYTITLDSLDYSISLARTGGQGAIGYSAYELAVQNGFIGTEQEWLDAMAMTVDALEAYDQSASASAQAAATSETNADTSEANALTSATNAAFSASDALVSKNAAAVSASAALTSETNAAISAQDAEASEISASTSANNATNSAASATISKDAAALSATNAATSASASATSATSSANSASNAAVSETNALNYSDDANDSAVAAATSATSAATSATNSFNSANSASNSASEAATSASSALFSANSASNSANTATTKASEAASSAASALASSQSASTSASNANTSATNAAASATSALASSQTAATSETNAATSASNAATSEVNALAYKNAAQTSATNAATSATNAAISEANASTSEANALSYKNAAATSASNAATSATNASTSATNAANSATSASNSAANALASETSATNSAQSAASSLQSVALIFDNFDDIYLGSKESDPTLDNDGDPLEAGAVYWNNLTTSLRFYNGNSWEDPEASTTASAAAALTSANNAATSATNAANSASASSAFATSAANSATSAANSASVALTSETNAAHSESEALASASDALSSKNAAAISESNAATSATSAATSATNAATSESNASSSEASATSSATSATSSANSASNSATSASSSASAAATSATNAAISESDAASHAASAASSESNAATSATNALNSENAAFVSEQAAATSATSALTSATNAAASATAASTSASNAATSATSAATSATSASNYASDAATSATNAAASATNAAISATSAATSATNAAASETSALESLTQVSNIYDQFDDRYLGSKASAPTLDNDGNTLLEGALYWNSINKVIYVFNGTSWIQTITVGALTADNNLSDLSNTTTALVNLGLSPTDDVEFGTIKLATSGLDNGIISWDSTIGTLKTTLNSGLDLHHGEELYYPLVKNTTASIITKGTAVGYNGVTSGAINIQPMIADSSIDYEHYLGLTSEDIGIGEYGRVNYFGTVSGINTNAYPVGTHLYVSDQTPGGFTATRPQSPSYSLRVGTVLIQDSTNGSISLVYDSIHNAEETNYDSSDTTLLATNVKAALDELSLTKVDIALLNANITFYPTTTIGDFGYYRLVTTTSDPDYDTVAVDVPTGTITANNQLLATLISDANIIKGDPGLINIPTIGNIAKISGNSTQFAAFYFELYRRNSGGTEILVGASNNTLNVNPGDTNYHQFNASALLANGTWATTDRLVVKYYAALTGNTGASYYFQFGGSYPIRTEFPAPVSVIPAAPSTEILTVTTNFNGILSGTDSTVQQALETLDDHDHDGIYELADATILKDADIGVIVQAYNASTVVDASYVHTDNNYTTTEKNKLAGIESGATADQTASEILDAIKTVDGSGSGLDADLLDGQHSSYFATATGLSTEISDRTTGDSNTLSSANTYTDNKVAALVDSAPATLDTLNELAAALGDDPNFATTVATSIGTKANSSVTITAGTNLTGGGDLTTNRTISHSASGVVAGTYGSSTSIPAITVDAQGHVTAASGNSISVGDGSMTVTAGSGLTGGGQVGTANQSGNTSITLSHADTSTQANLTASSRTYVTGLTFDTYGHVTGLTTGTETVVDTNTTYNAGTGLSLSDTTFNMDVNGLTEITGLESTDTIPVYDASGTAVRKVQIGNTITPANFNGTLTVAKGGTGATTLTGYVYGNGTGAMTASASIPNSATTATSANTASAIVARDASGNFSAGTITASLSGNATTATTADNVSGVVALANGGTGKTTAPAAWANLNGYTSTATAAGTTTLTNTSSRYQVFTGTTTQTIVLPVTSTLQTGWEFKIVNNSTDNLTVQSSGLNTISTIIPGMTTVYTCIGITLTTAADWESDSTGIDTYTGTGAMVLATSPTLVTPALGTPSSGTLTNCTFPTLNQNTTGSAATLTTGRTIAMTGDVTWTSPTFNGSADVTAAGTLATVNANTGSFGSASAIPVITVNGKGLITAVSTAAVAGGQYFGSAATKAIAYNSATIAENVTVTNGNNGLSAGPITINNAYSVTIESGANWIVI